MFFGWPMKSSCSACFPSRFMFVLCFCRLSSKNFVGQKPSYPVNCTYTCPVTLMTEILSNYFLNLMTLSSFLVLLCFKIVLSISLIFMWYVVCSRIENDVNKKKILFPGGSQMRTKVGQQLMNRQSCLKSSRTWKTHPLQFQTISVKLCNRRLSVQLKTK